MSPEAKSTADILLESAGELFAKKGFAGTSIREIATKAGVNVAAVNYHFQSKENLYAEVFRYNWNKLDYNILQLAQKFKNASLHQLSYEMFLLFEASETALANSFKVILTDEVTLPDNYHFNNSKQFGPPGGEPLLDHVTRTIGEDIDLEIRGWVVEVIFTYIAHMALISSATSLKNIKEISQVCNASTQKNSIYHLVEATLTYAKSNKKPWDQLHSMS